MTRITKGIFSLLLLVGVVSASLFATTYTVSFDWSPSSNIMHGQTVQFHNTSNPRGGKWEWLLFNFQCNNGEREIVRVRSTEENPQFTLLGEGNHQVTLKVWVWAPDGNYWRYAGDHTELVYVGAASPSCDFTISPASPEIGQTVWFKDCSATTNPPICLSYYLVDAPGGDRTRLDGSRVSYAFSKPGTYRIKHIIKDATLVDDMKTVFLDVGGAPPCTSNKPPANITNITGTMRYQAKGNGIFPNTCLAWSASDPEGDPLIYDVYFGDTPNPPLACSGVTYIAWCIDKTLPYNTTFYWKVVAKDTCHPGGTSSPIWSFRTPSANDIEPPNLALPRGTVRCGTAGGEVTFSWTATDNVTSSSKIVYRYRLDGGIWSTWSGAKTKSYSELSNGGHTFETEARDLAGNVRIRKETFTVNCSSSSLPTPHLARAPNRLDFGTSLTSKTFSVWNSDGGTLSYTISSHTSWIKKITPASGSSTGEHRTITIIVSRSGLSAGHYTGAVTINSNGGSQTVQVAMDVPPSTSAPPPSENEQLLKEFAALFAIQPPDTSEMSPEQAAQVLALMSKAVEEAHAGLTAKAVETVKELLSLTGSSNVVLVNALRTVSTSATTCSYLSELLAQIAKETGYDDLAAFARELKENAGKIGNTSDLISDVVTAYMLSERLRNTHSVYERAKIMQDGGVKLLTGTLSHTSKTIAALLGASAVESIPLLAVMGEGSIILQVGLGVVLQAGMRMSKHTGCLGALSNSQLPWAQRTPCFLNECLYGNRSACSYVTPYVEWTFSWHSFWGDQHLICFVHPFAEVENGDTLGVFVDLAADGQNSIQATAQLQLVYANAKVTSASSTVKLEDGIKQNAWHIPWRGIYMIPTAIRISLAASDASATFYPHIQRFELAFPTKGWQ